MWPLPRELLWAVIFTLAIFLVANWQSPLQQSPQVGQHQTKNTDGSDNATGHGPPSPVSGAGHPQQSEGQQNASEVTFLSVKPGEWLLAIVTWMLWLATARLVQGADKTAERQLRAYVRVHHVDMPHRAYPSGPTTNLEQMPGAIHSFRLTATLENTGQTPTRKALTNTNYRCFAGAMPTDFDFPSGQNTERADFGARSPYMAPSITIPGTDLTRAVNGTHRLYTWGWIEYDDVFDNTPRHRTEFCFEIEPERGLPVDDIPIQFTPRGRFNGADGDCLRQPSPYADPD